MVVRLIDKKDYKEVAAMIARTVDNSEFTKFYPAQTIDEVKQSLNEEGVKNRASWTHFYVIEENNKIVACGAIGPYYNSQTESSLFSRSILFASFILRLVLHVRKSTPTL